MKMGEALTPAGYLHEDVVLMLCDVETTGLGTDDHVIDLAVVLVTWPGLEELAVQEWLIQPPDRCFERDPRGGLRWGASERGAGRVHQILPEQVCSLNLWERFYLKPGTELPATGKERDDALWALRETGPLPTAEVAIELMDLIASVKRTSRARKIILTSDNIVFEHRHVENVLKAAGERWPFHYCSWDTSLLLDGTGVGDPSNPPHRAMADTRALLGQLRAAMQSIRPVRPAEGSTLKWVVRCWSDVDGGDFGGEWVMRRDVYAWSSEAAAKMWWRQVKDAGVPRTGAVVSVTSDGRDDGSWLYHVSDAGLRGLTMEERSRVGV